MTITLNDEQEAAVAKLHAWYHSGTTDPFVFLGPAGSGKTTVMGEFVRRLAKEASGPIIPLYGAYTGAAAKVARSKGCVGATTLHRILYQPRATLASQQADACLKAIEFEKDPEKLAELHEALKVHQSKEQVSFNATGSGGIAPLIIIDECSMIPNNILADLYDLNTRLLFTGDPYQLPPVSNTKEMNALFQDPPDVLLTKIMRQAEGSPIIQMASRVREGEEPPLGEFGESFSFRSRDIPTGERLQMMMSADKVIAGKNVTRVRNNIAIRKLKGLPHDRVIVGDVLTCRKNVYRDVIDKDGKVEKIPELVSGGEYLVKSVKYWEDPASPYERLNMTLCDPAFPDEIIQAPNANSYRFRGHYLDPYKGLQTMLPPPFPLSERATATIVQGLNRDRYQFDWSHVSTCHNAQGNQWDSVYVIDESRVFKKDKDRWLYTAITRAAKAVCLEYNA